MPVDDAQAHASVAYPEGGERNSPRAGMGAETGAAAAGRTKAGGPRMMESAVERGNMWLAYQRVVQNKGGSGR